jgi:hypothetical protein
MLVSPVKSPRVVRAVCAQEPRDLPLSLLMPLEKRIQCDVTEQNCFSIVIWTLVPSPFTLRVVQTAFASTITICIHTLSLPQASDHARPFLCFSYGTYRLLTSFPTTRTFGRKNQLLSVIVSEH